MRGGDGAAQVTGGEEVRARDVDDAHGGVDDLADGRRALRQQLDLVRQQGEGGQDRGDVVGVGQEGQFHGPAPSSPTSECL